MYCPDHMLEPPARTWEQEEASRLYQRYDELKEQITVLTDEKEYIAQALSDLGYPAEPPCRRPLSCEQAVRWAADFAASVGREDVSYMLDRLSDRMEYGAGPDK